MKNLLMLPFLLALAACASTPAKQDKKDTESLQAWIDNELAPYLEKNLSEVPKFSGEPVLIVAMDGEQISSDINGLTSDIRRQLVDSLLANPRVRLVRRQLDYQNQRQLSLTRISCDRDTDVRYFVGLDIDQSAVSGEYTVRVRAMEADNPNQWVSGIAATWEGQLNVRQKNALAQKEKDPFLQGLRSRPFGKGESDLLAQYVAHNMSCLLAEAKAPAIQLYTKPLKQGTTDTLRTSVSLIDNYLSQFQEIQQTSKLDEANAIMEYEFLPVDKRKNLWLMSLSVSFKETGDRVQGVDTQAYITINPWDIVREPQPTPDDNTVANTRKADFIDQFNFVIPSRASSCERRNPWGNGERDVKSQILGKDDCFAIEYSSKGRDTVLVYENTVGQLYELTEQCVTADTRRGVTRMPSVRADQPAIYLDDSRGFEHFYLVSFKNKARSSVLNNYLNSLPGLCGDRGRTVTPAQLSEALDKYLQDNPGDMDWEKITIDHR